jgi:hypothetical protein
MYTDITDYTAKAGSAKKIKTSASVQQQQIKNRLHRLSQFSLAYFGAALLSA